MQIILWIIILVIVALFAGYALHFYKSPMHDHKILGRVEIGYLGDEHVKLKVRMDTGAKTSSLSAHDIELFDKDGKPYVRFVIERDRTHKLFSFELPLKRLVKIRKRQAEMQDEQEDEDIEGDAAFEQRPVVLLPLCIGNVHQIIEVTLTDRSNLNYPMLLGRSGMRAFGVLIDPSTTFTQKSQYHKHKVTE